MLLGEVLTTRSSRRRRRMFAWCARSLRTTAMGRRLSTVAPKDFTESLARTLQTYTVVKSASESFIQRGSPAPCANSSS
eukprot:177774-Alexandrium_andersonii.AAC.1